MQKVLLAQIHNPVISETLGGDPTTDGGSALAELMARLFRISMVIGGLALILYIAWGGLSWITAGGDKGKIEEARSRITNGILGMAILVGTVAIASLLSGDNLFGFDLLNPSLNFGDAATN